MRSFIVGLIVVAAALAGAFYYLSTPDIPRSVLEAKYASPPSEFITLPDGARAHVRDEGPRNAPVLVLIHGSNASLFTWRPWAERLDPTFRVVTMDMPGHGLTGAVPNNDYSGKAMVEFVREVADKLGLSRFAIGGNSMGGGIAARFAETYPARVTQLILVDAGGLPSKTGDKIPLAFQLARTPVLNQVLLYITPRSLVVEGLNDAIVRKAIINDAMVQQYWDFARMAGTRAATGERFRLRFDTYVADHIDTLKMPTLILWGEEDHLIPVAAAHEYAKDVPGSKLIVYPATGHIPQEEVADQSAADVKSFLLATAKP
ncbi:MAG: alpha/beta hydrolase [Rhizomicrobium sp.]|jgi:pimeloyl-ACP methyl ester carboxylesterase